MLHPKQIFSQQPFWLMQSTPGWSNQRHLTWIAAIYVNKCRWPHQLSLRHRVQRPDWHCSEGTWGNDRCKNHPPKYQQVCCLMGPCYVLVSQNAGCMYWLDCSGSNLVQKSKWRRCVLTESYLRKVRQRQWMPSSRLSHITAQPFYLALILVWPDWHTYFSTFRSIDVLY